MIPSVDNCSPARISYPDRPIIVRGRQLEAIMKSRSTTVETQTGSLFRILSPMGSRPQFPHGGRRFLTTSQFEEPGLNLTTNVVSVKLSILCAEQVMAGPASAHSDQNRKPARVTARRIMEICARTFCIIVASWVWVVTLAVRSAARPQDIVPPSSRAESEAKQALPATPAGPAIPTSNSDYIIGPEDVLAIDVFEMPELSRTVRVGTDGTISLPLLGSVKAAGLTSEQLRNELESQWDKTYFRNPQVSVFVREYHAQPVAVLGPVERPGLYQLTGPRTLIEVLSMAGGLAHASTVVPGRTVFVTRKGGFGALQPVEGMYLITPEKVEIDLQRLLYSRDAALNIPIMPLDIVSVNKSDLIYVVGGVRRPDGFTLGQREKFTVLQALAMAGGLSGTAAKRGARIIRASSDGSRIEIPVNLGKLLKGKSQDLELSPNDILYVPESTVKGAGKRGLEAVIATVSGAVVVRSVPR